MFNRTRRISKHLEIGSVPLGGNAPISVQSMTTTDTRDIDATVAQIKKLEDAGCDIVRVAVLDKVAAEAIAPIKRQISIPLVADIHFQYRLALLSIKHGVDKLRINPGNIGDDSKVGQVAAAAREGGVPIRIGVNSGSLEDDLLNQYGRHHPEALVESALRKVRLLEKHNFHDIVISLKSSEVPVMVAAYRSIAKRCDYPLHLGVTEAGPLLRGTTKSALAFGLLLHEGIGDTLRVSLSADPVEEVKVGRLILQSLGFPTNMPELVSCPTCGRLQTDLLGLITRIEKLLEGIKKPIRVAVMGCVVNGPGEAADADIAVIGGKGYLTLIRNGEIIGKFPPDKLEECLLKELEAFR